MNDDGYESTPPTELDISLIIKEQGLLSEDNQEKKEFESLSKNVKLDRLNNLIQKSQVYSQIIADNILQSSLAKKKELEGKKSVSALPSKKKRKTKKNYDITSMLSTKISDSTKSVKESINAHTEKSTQQPTLITGGVMKDYQLDGLHWLTTLYENGLNGILADEMGLGKTLQCISFLGFLIEQGVKGPFLIIVPLSTLSNWCNEIEKFAPDIKYIKYNGTKQQRSAMNLSKWIKDKKINIVLTSYEISIRDFNKFRTIEWNYLIIDEGHRLKNTDCLLIQILKKLSVANRLLITGTPLQNNLNELWSLLNFILPDIFHDLELFQQWFNFDELTNFEKNSVDEDDEETNKLIKMNIQESLIRNLHTILKPFILRRMKRDVIKDLPPKKEYLIHIPLTDLQKKLYFDTINNRLGASIVEVNLKEFINFNHSQIFSTHNDFELIDKFLSSKLENPILIKKSISQSYKEAESDDDFEVGDSRELSPDANDYTSVKERIKVGSISKQEKQHMILEALYQKFAKRVRHLSLQNMMMQLRNICNSPYLFYEPFDVSETTRFDEKMFMSILFKNSAKVRVLDQLCAELIKSNHKILIFSQFTRLLDLLHDWFDYKNIGFSRLDGSTSLDRRDEEIKRFSNDPQTKVFLLSTRAGGLGINLTAADTVILFDNDWNPQMDLQAIDRVHRIGQENPVKIYRFLTRDSIEEILISKSSSKRFLEKLVIQMGEFKFNKLKKLMGGEEAANNVLNVKELLDLSKTTFKNDSHEELSKSNDSGFKYEYGKSSAESGMKKLLSEKEMFELMDRSSSCYHNSDDTQFTNISIFETVNNMDK